MNTDAIARAIKKARESCCLTQSMLAKQMGVSVQAVSKWENGKNLPDIENLFLIAELTNTPYQTLLSADLGKCEAEHISFRERLFHEDNMYTRMKAVSLAEDLPETFKALQYMRKQHMGQFRKQGKFSHELVQYINHPLLMACHAHALGVRDDTLLAAILLHDVVEDTDVTLAELPFSEEVRTIIGLVTFSVPNGMTKGEAKEAYYAQISQNAKACVVKIIDRCNNVSTMAGSFSREKIFEYIDETERYILPLTDILKNEYPAYCDLAFVVKYQIFSLIETTKYLLIA